MTLYDEFVSQLGILIDRQQMQAQNQYYERQQENMHNWLNRGKPPSPKHRGPNIIEGEYSVIKEPINLPKL